MLVLQQLSTIKRYISGYFNPLPQLQYTRLMTVVVQTTMMTSPTYSSHTGVS